MIRLMIVDDEQPIIDGLKELIDWNGIGVEIVASANSGEEALDVAARVMPDLILTDIRMPGMSGLELIKRIKIVLPDTKGIILSGYQDFEYAKEAMRYNSIGYLIKPVDEMELKNIVMEARDNCVERIDERHRVQNLNRKFEESVVFAKNQVLYSIVNGEITDPEIAGERLRYFGFQDLPECYLCFAADIETSCNDVVEDQDTDYVRFAVASVIDDLIRSHAVCSVFFNTGKQIYGIIEVKSDEIRVEDILKSILCEVPNIINYQITLGASNVHRGFKNIKKAYKEAKSALKYKLLEGKGSYIRYKDAMEYTGDSANSVVKVEKKLVNNVICGDSDSIRDVVEEFFRILTEDSASGPERIISECRELLILVRKSMEEIGLNYSEGVCLSNSFEIQLEDLSLSELKQNMSMLLRETALRISRKSEGNVKALISQIIEYIDSNYSNQITLNSISGRFYINSSYISRLFKQEANESFIEYLTRKRLEEAKQLLLHTNYRIYEISQMIGYNNNKYFSQLFEKETGMTPREFRRSNGIRDIEAIG